MKIVILYSSGLDSFILYQYAKARYPQAQLKCLYFKHGADSEAQEIARLPDYVEVRNIDWLNENCRPVAKKSDPFAGEIYIPGRNLVFTVLAAAQELPDEIWMGTLWDEDNAQATDKNGLFRTDTSDLMTYVLSPFLDQCILRFPFVEEGWTKSDIVEWALYSGIPKEEIKATVSCWHYTDKPCGRCKQCFKRKLNLKPKGIIEDYAKDPLDSEYGYPLIRGYIIKAGHNDANRDEKTVAKLIKEYYTEKELLDILFKDNYDQDKRGSESNYFG